MSQVKLYDSDQYALPNTNNRFIHIATLTKGFKTYLYFIDIETQKRYIEDFTLGQLEFIEDNQLAQELENFIHERRLDEVLILPDRFLLKPPNIRKPIDYYDFRKETY